MNLLSATGVSHDYPHHGRVLHAIHLAIAPGETVALLGRSGCGKSTLARMLVGLETPQHGDIAWRGTPLAALKGESAEDEIRAAGNVLRNAGLSTEVLELRAAPGVEPTRAVRVG